MCKRRQAARCFPTSHVTPHTLHISFRLECHRALAADREHLPEQLSGGQNNIIQSAATSAVSTAFMCVVAAAFGYLAMNESVDVHLTITPWQMFTWLCCSGAIGVFMSAMFRKYFVDDPEMIFADGVAAAETINVLDQGKAAGQRFTV